MIPLNSAFFSHYTPIGTDFQLLWKSAAGQAAHIFWEISHIISAGQFAFYRRKGKIYQMNE
jgi:hypothetical protein